MNELKISRKILLVNHSFLRIKYRFELVVKPKLVKYYKQMLYGLSFYIELLFLVFYILYYNFCIIFINNVKLFYNISHYLSSFII